MQNARIHVEQDATINGRQNVNQNAKNVIKYVSDTMSNKVHATIARMYVKQIVFPLQD